MNFIVTGGAGFIGRHLVESLRSLGNVTVIDSGEVGKLDQLPEGVDLVESDIVDFSVAEWGDLLQGVDCLFHLAATKHNTPGVSSDKLFETNVNATWRMAQAAGLAKVRRFVFASSLYAYGNLGRKPMSESNIPKPNTLYGSSKLMGEGILRTSFQMFGLKYSALRLFFIYGPGQYAEGGYKSVIVTNFERMLQGEPPTINGDGTQALDYVFVDDAVRAFVAASQSSESELLLNISSGQAVSIHNLTSAMQKAVGSHFAPSYLPPDWTAGTVRYGSPDLAVEKLGWKSQTSLQDGLEQTWRSFNQ